MACLVTVLFLVWKTLHKNLLGVYYISAFLFIVIFTYIFIQIYLYNICNIYIYNIYNIYNIYTIYIQYIYNIYIQYIYNIYTIYTIFIQYLQIYLYFIYFILPWKTLLKCVLHCRNKNLLLHKHKRTSPKTYLQIWKTLKNKIL